MAGRRKRRPRAKPPGDARRGRKAWDPNTIDPETGIMRSELAIGARRAYNSLEDIASSIYGGAVTVRTILRHFRACGRCRFCQGMHSAPAATRIQTTGTLLKYATDDKSPHHYKALALMATHAPGSPLRQRVEVGQSEDLSRAQVEVDDEGVTWWAKPVGGSKAWKRAKD